MLTLWNNPFLPTRKLERRDNINRLFDSLFDGVFDNAFVFAGLDHKKNEDGSLSITVDVPGVKEEDINVEMLEDNVITIKGERKTATSSYSINKSFTIPEGYDINEVKAELKDGILTLNLAAKALPEVKEPKKIPITVSK